MGNGCGHLSHACGWRGARKVFLREEKSLLGSLLVFDIDVNSIPTHNLSVGGSLGNSASKEPSIYSVSHLGCAPALRSFQPMSAPLPNFRGMATHLPGEDAVRKPPPRISAVLLPMYASKSRLQYSIEPLTSADQISLGNGFGKKQKLTLSFENLLVRLL